MMSGSSRSQPSGERRAKSDPPSGYLDGLFREMEDFRELRGDLGWGVEGLAFDDFEILGKLGRGGMGVVYLAKQKSLRRLVALKALSPHLCDSPESKERLRREAFSIARLRHPNLVPVFALGEKDDTPFLAMEFIQGVSLSKILQGLAGADPSKLDGPTVRRVYDELWKMEYGGFIEKGIITNAPEYALNDFWTQSYPKIAAAIASQIADALDYAHRSDIIHRDVKPSNILIARSGQAYLVDFGLASEASFPSLTASDEFVGTLSYASPESLLGKEGRRNPLGDIYSLGLVLYEMLTLSQPFEAETKREILNRLHTIEPEPARRFNAKIPADLQTICMKAFDREPGWRYQTAGLLAADLKNFQDGKPIQGKQGRKLSKFLRRHRRAAAILGAAAMLSPLAFSLLSPKPAAPPEKTIVAKPPEEPKSAPPAETPEKKIERFRAAERFLAEGLACFIEMNYEEGIRVLEALIADQKDYLSAYPFLAGCYVRKGQNAEALKVLNRALVLRPNSPPFQHLRNWILKQPGMQSAGPSLLLSRPLAAEELPPLEAKDSRDSHDQAAVLVLDLLEDKLDAAVEDLNQANLFDKFLVWPYLARGYLNMVLERYDTALGELTAYNLLVPDEPRGIVALGILSQRRGEFQKAESLFRQGLQLIPDYVWALFGLLQLELERKDLPSAEVYAEKLTQKFPENGAFLSMQAQIEEGLGKWEDALRIFEKLAALSGPGNADAHRKLAALYSGNPPHTGLKSDLDKALLHARKMVEIAGAKNFSDLRTLAEILFQKKNKAEAVQTAQTALQLKDVDPGERNQLLSVLRRWAPEIRAR